MWSKRPKFSLGSSGKTNPDVLSELLKAIHLFRSQNLLPYHGPAIFPRQQVPRKLDNTEESICEHA